MLEAVTNAVLRTGHALRTQVHQAVGRMLARGSADGSINVEASACDIIVFGRCWRSR